MPKRFANYPLAVEAPKVPYKKEDDANPVFSGRLLAIGAWLITKVQPAQKYLWHNAGFDGLRKVPHLRDYTPRYDPTVIPLTVSTPHDPLQIDPQFFPKQSQDLPGRYYSIMDYHEMYLSGQLTPLNVVEYLLPIIRRDVQSPSHHSIAFIDSKTDLIMDAAKASTERYKAGKHLGIMDGIPTAVKDEGDVAGYRTTGGRKRNDEFFKIATKSTRPAQLLQESGAIILGKLNMHELGADTTNNNPNWGTPRNPHNDQYYTGGSSGGSAYVVAAGLVPFALGADGGGSIRIPSSFCGVYGLKPSHNRLEDTGSTVTVTGPLAATMADLEMAYRTMAVPEPKHPISSLFAPPGPLTMELDPKKTRYIGLVDSEWIRADNKSSAWSNAMSHLERHGYKRVAIDLPYLPEGQLAHAMTILSEMTNGSRSDPMYPNNWFSGLNAANKVLLGVGDQTPAQDFLLAQQLRNMLMQHLAFLYKKYPGLLIITPTTPMSGWPIRKQADLTHGITDGNTSIRSMQFVWLANFCGNPAITVPYGYAEPVKGEGKIPLGLMAMAEWGGEDELLAWGRVMEKWLGLSNEGTDVIGGGGRVRPSNWVDILVNARKKVAT
ncbi:amidase signature enzyme [Mollisia scopiformis]|uniref:Amidase signature enzyme n=1 Tax=Mollisia scopiformis TaxID=149040 RepID=A0A132B8D9_MOLSC|nr:amidase signature enzyme [Mollisia scopiformis]KUJ08665.1 amidase signature enzyme [Mollisia scopiformis]